MKTQSHFNLWTRLSLAACLVLGLSLEAHAASATWSGTDANGQWNDNNNWGGTAFPGGPSGTADTATFSSAATITTLGTAISAGAINLTTGNAVSITDATNALTLNGSTPITDSNGGTLTFNTNVTFASATGGQITLGGGSSVVFNNTLTENAAAPTFSGGGSVTLNGTYTTNKTTSLGNGATLNLGHNLNATIHLGTSTSSSTTNNTSSLVITTNGVTDGAVVQGIGFDSAGAAKNTYTFGSNISGGGTALFNGSFSINNSSNTNAGVIVFSAISGNTLDIASTISGASGTTGMLVQASGGGVVLFNGGAANNFTTSSTATGTEVKGNTILQLEDTGGVALTGNTTVDSGSTIQLLATGQMTTGTLTINGAGGTNGGVQGSATVSALENFSGTNTLTAAIALGSASTIASDSGTSLALTGGITNGGNTLSFAGAGATTVSTAPITGVGGLTMGGTGTLTLSGSNGYSGLTTVSSGAVIVTNTVNSATGTGSLTVTGSATFGGTGISSGTGYSISGSGTATGTRATVLVGRTSTADTNTLSILTLTGSGSSLIQNANLSFNINAHTAGGLGGTSNGGSAGGLGVSGSGTEMSVGNTAITFGSGVGSVVLTLNVQGEPAIIGNNTAYVLIAGTATSGSGFHNSQYSGISGNTTTLSANESETLITSGNLQLAFGSTLDGNYYAGSYMVLYQNTLTGTDDIDVIVVPEPGTWAMMLSGLAVLVFWQRRKSRA